MKRKTEWNKLLLVGLISAFLFSAGLLGGYLISLYSKNEVKIVQEGIYNDLLELNLQKDLLNKYPCSETRLNLLTDKLAYVGEVVDLLEKRLGFNNGDVKNVKRLYILLQLEHYMLEQERNVECKDNNTLILFFYSNNDASQRGENIGSILGYIRSNNQNVRVYSFDTSVKVDAVETIKGAYNITTLPTVVVGNVTLLKVTSKDDILPYIK